MLEELIDWDGLCLKDIGNTKQTNKQKTPQTCLLGAPLRGLLQTLYLDDGIKCNLQIKLIWNSKIHISLQRLLTLQICHMDNFLKLLL